EHADLADDPAIGREEWRSSMEQIVGSKASDHQRGSHGPQSGLMYWDLRSREAYMRYIDGMMTHRNPYTGLTYAEDPSVAVIELMNEQWWLPRSLGGALFDDLPEPLMKSLLKKWNAWLAGEYTDTDGLEKAWGKLMSSESLEKQTVLLQPLQGQKASDKMSGVLGIAKDYAKGAAVGVPESKQRKNDVVRFLTEIHLDFCEEAIARIRSHGKPNRGAAVVPIVIDTGASYSMPSQYEHASGGSALACATYVHQFDTDKSKDTYPWLAALKNPPYFNSWVDQNKVEGLPSFFYEMMFFQPGKYRADFALRLLGLASIQDFCVVDWHFYQPYFDKLENEPLRIPTGGHYWNGVIYGNDEVAMATMLLASEIFRHGNLQTPKNPTVLEINNEFLFNPDNLKWGRFKKAMSPTVFQHGLRLRFNPAAEESRYIGPHPDGTNVPGIVHPTPEISYFWKEGYMVIESERVRLVAGFLPESFTFEGGEKLAGISVNNPDDIPYVIPGERYACFAMCSRDEKPLEESSDIIAMAVSTSWNTGFKFDVDKWDDLQKTRNHPPLNASKSVKRGTLPILVSRVGWTFDAPWLKGMTATHYDFGLNAYEQGKIQSRQYSIENTEQLFFVEFTSRGDAGQGKKNDAETKP
ncbi:MAG: hypothetical protein ABFR33_07440, partial [Verrucomicrobiota bacterium]